MSFNPPTTGIVTIDGGTSTIASGTIALQLNVKTVSGLSTTDYTMDVIDIGSIEVDYDYLEGIGDITEFGINVPMFDFTIRDTIRETSTPTNTESFVEILTKLNQNDLVVAKITINGQSDYYYTTRDQCEFSYKDRKVKIKTQHPLKYGAVGFGRVWDEGVYTLPTTNAFVNTDFVADPSATPVSHLFVKDIIDRYIYILGDVTSTYINSTLYTQNSTSSYSYGDIAYLTNMTPSGSFAAADRVVKSAALSESAILGNILGYAFYTPRYSKDSSVQATLNANDFESVELDPVFKNIRYFSLDFNLAQSNAYEQNVTVIDELINDIGTNNASVNYGFLNLIPAIYDEIQDGSGNYYNVFASGTLVYTGSNSEYYPNTFPAGYEDSVVSSYKQIFRISEDAANGIAIAGTILGIDKLKPHGYFTVSSGVHPLVDGKDFRPSYLKFNLKEDKIEFEAYSF